MPLEPGPIELIHIPADFEAVELAGFAQLVYEMEGEQQRVEETADFYEAQAIDAIAPDFRSYLEDGVEDAENALDLEERRRMGPDLGDAVVAQDEVDAIIIEASQEIPGEAYQPVPAPLGAPVSPPEFSVLPDQPIPDPTSGYNLAPIAPPTLQTRAVTPIVTAAPTVKLLNLTAPLLSYFSVGDKFRIDITGAPFAAVAASAMQNGNVLGQTNFGSTDAAGRFALEGFMGPEHRGSWIETWYGGNTLAFPQVAFFVL